MRSEDIAWAAGLFEGEGCLFVHSRTTGRVDIQLRLAMSDHDVVERFAAAVGCGTIRSRQPREKHWKPMYEWSVYEAVKVRAVVALFMPFLGERRRIKARELLRRGADIQAANAKKTHCPKGHSLLGNNILRERVKRRLATGELKTYTGAALPHLPKTRGA